MTNRFWRTPGDWPLDPPRYVFLARAFDEIGRALFGDKWSREVTPPKTKLADSQMSEKSQELADNDDLESILLDENEKDNADDEHHRMWVAVKDEILKQCLAGHLVGAVRPTEGGETTDLQAKMWNAEKLGHRFDRCQMSLRHPFATSPKLDPHWIFLSRESLRKYLAAQPYGSVSTETPKHISPYLKIMLIVTERMDITPDKQPKKDEVIAEIDKTWTGKQLSRKLAEVMATLIREPESQLGRAKKENIR
jgi:hypothetical protein